MDNWWATLLAPLTASKGAAYETRARHYLEAQGLGFVITSYSIHYTKLYEVALLTSVAYFSER